MSGNLWMFSDMLDDEDIEMQKHDFITLYQGADYYGLGLKVFTRMAREAGSVYKIGKKALIRRTIFDEYLRKVYKKELEKNSSDDSGKELMKRQGTMVTDEDSGRMDIRFGLLDYYVAYIMSAYSTSVDQLSATQTDLEAKLSGVSGNMFPVTSVEKENEVITPVTYYTYKPVTMTVVTRIVQTGTINGVPQYRYETDEKTYYVQDEEKTSGVSIEVDAYTAVTVTLPVYSGGSISGTRTATYYQSAGKQTLTPTKEIVKYLECTIHPFDNTVISSAFGLDLNAEYSQFGTTYGQVIDSRAQALKMTLYGTASNGSAVPLTDTELIAFLARQNCSETRKHIVKTGLSLVGKVPYFWGGKSAAGWNDEWNTPKLVTAAGSTTSGTIRPFGLDCSGFTDWTYKTAVGVSLYGGTWSQWDESYAITADELLPGDLGFLMDSDGQGWNHVLIFAGYGENGERMWVHSSGGEGVILNTPSYEASLSLRRPKNINFEDSSVIPDVE